MVAFASLVFGSLLVSSALGFPLALAPYSSSSLFKPKPVSPISILCSIPIIDLLCPQSRATSSSSGGVSTLLGTAEGVADTSDVTRYAVRYASADRWQPSVLASSWELPSGAANASDLPLACPQNNVTDSTFSEDCLAMLLYVPSTLSSSSGAPTLMWIHGGSFQTGSATGPGLDGSALASATNSIVAVVQYRLGVLGFVAPNGGTNLAVMDTMNAMAFLQKIVPSFGGSSSKITLAGQSSGANMIRALLATPSASSMFQNAILQSDPMDYGFLSTDIQSQLVEQLMSNLPCSQSDTACLDALSLDTVLNAQYATSVYAVNYIPAAGSGEPIRPVYDGELITTTLDSTTPFPSVSKPLLISNVADEAASDIYSSFDSAVPYDEYDYVVNVTFGQPRAGRLLTNDLYTPPPVANDGDEDARPVLTTLGTDQIWRCATWTFARNWAAAGAQAFVGTYVVGATYPPNADIAACTVPGAVCHQDDIEIVFGTVPSPTSAQSSLITEVQARYAAFMNTGNPNTGSYAQWEPAGTENITSLQLGGDGAFNVGACSYGYWGSYVEYDYQVYGL